MKTDSSGFQTPRRRSLIGANAIFVRLETAVVFGKVTDRSALAAGSLLRSLKIGRAVTMEVYGE